MNHIKLDNLNFPKDVLQTKVVENLYILKNNLIGNSLTSEIEDLFQTNVLDITIDGKKFCRKKDFDETKHFSKQIFSEYISKNYKQINFDSFKPMLDALTEVVKNYN